MIRIHRNIKIHKIPILFIQLIGIFFLSSFYGCILPSKDDLFEPSEPSLVIEGMITDSLPPYHVKVSWSVPGKSDLNSAPVDSAHIILSDNHGNSELLELTGNGVYSSSFIQGIIGNRYQLKIQVGDGIFYSSELMRQKPSIDSVTIAYEEITVPEDGYYITIHGHRPNDTINYYRLDLRTADTVYQGYSDLLIWEDSRTLANQSITIPYAFNLSDTVFLTIYSITESMYNYYNGLLKQTQNNFSNIQPPKLNPPSNFNPQPLGYFQVSPITNIKVVIATKAVH